MLLSQLITELQCRMECHGDVPVSCTWEGTLHNLDPDNLYMAKIGILIIDADGNSYKEQYQNERLNF